MLIELRKYHQARDCFSKAKKMVHNSSLNASKIEKFNIDMDKQFTKIQDKKDRKHVVMWLRCEQLFNHDKVNVITPFFDFSGGEK